MYQHFEGYVYAEIYAHNGYVRMLEFILQETIFFAINLVNIAIRFVLL